MLVPTGAGGPKEKPEAAEWLGGRAGATEEDVTVLGQGSFGKVLRQGWLGTSVAVKFLKMSRLYDFEVRSLRREIAITGALRHPHVVALLGVILQDPPVRLVLEYCQGGTLCRLLHSRRARVELVWAQKGTILEQVAQALAYAHHKRVAHGDLKSNNVLLMQPVVSRSQTPFVKLGDFGLGSFLARAVDPHLVGGGVLPLGSGKSMVSQPGGGGSPPDDSAPVQRMFCHAPELLLFRGVVRRVRFSLRLQDPPTTFRAPDPSNFPLYRIQWPADGRRRRGPPRGERGGATDSHRDRTVPVRGLSVGLSPGGRYVRAAGSEPG